MVTIYEVAKLANVAPKTAARVLAGADVRPYNLEKVLNAARQLGYVRNQHAANLRSGKSNLIGVMVPDVSNPAYPVFFQRIHDVSVEFGYQILFSNLFDRPEQELRTLRMFESNRVDGVVLQAPESESNKECDAVIERLSDRGVPVIFAGRPAKGLPVDEIVIRNVQAVKRATHYLVNAGHTRIGFLSGKTGQARHERHTGWEQGMAEAGLATRPHWTAIGEWTADSGRDLTRQMLKGPRPRPTAVLAASDLLAAGALSACRELALRVPKDLAVVGFDDVPLAQLVSPTLTTLRVPHDQIARDCINLLVLRIQNCDTSNPRKLVYDPELIVRESA